MPFGDRTGPAGLGPRTGRGAGFCSGFSVPGYMNPVLGRSRFGFGGARGRGFFGRGRGRGRGRGWFGRGSGWRSLPGTIGVPGWRGYDYPIFGDYLYR